MAEVKAALDDAISGHGWIVMRAGEPGFGKTRTAQSKLSSARCTWLNAKRIACLFPTGMMPESMNPS